jgi:hypothetical protein
VSEWIRVVVGAAVAVLVGGLLTYLLLRAIRSVGSNTPTCLLTTI